MKRICPICQTELKNNTFNINQFYKVQLRFDAYSGDASSLLGNEAGIIGAVL